jgi:hypothetical protein
MAHFAKVQNNIVTQVITIKQTSTYIGFIGK